MSWLDSFFTGGIKTVQDNGSNKTQRAILNIIGATISDDPAGGRTNVSFTASGFVSSFKSGSGGTLRTGAVEFDATAPIVLTDNGGGIFALNFALGSQTTGDLVYFDGANWSRIPIGTSNQVLSVSGGVPTWATFAVAPGTAGQLYQTNAVPAAGWVTVTGDTTISSSGVTTTGKVNGTTYPAGGGLTTGNVPTVTAAGAVTYQAVNLAGGANFVTGALPLANIATGAAGTVLTGTGSTSAYSAAPAISGAMTVGSISGYAAQAFAFGTLSMSVAGGANVTLSTAQAQNRNITFTGAISADIFAIIPAGTTLVSGSEYVLTNSTTSTTTANAWMLNVKYASSGTGLWLPPGVPVRVVWNGSDFIYGEGSYAGGDLVLNNSIINVVGSYSIACFKVPANFLLVGVYLIGTAAPVGGTTSLSVGTTGGGSDLITVLTTGAIAFGAGITLSQLGSALTAANGYCVQFTAAQMIHFVQTQASASCTAGAYKIIVRGSVLQ